MLHHHQASVVSYVASLYIPSIFLSVLSLGIACFRILSVWQRRTLSDVHHVVAGVERLLRLNVSFFSLFYMGAVTKRPLFILFCQQPKRRGECPPNAIIQSTPSQRYTCFPLSKTDNFSSCDTETSSRVLFFSPVPTSVSFLSLSFLLLFYSPFLLRSIAKPPSPRHERFHGTNSLFLPRGYLFRFRSSAAHAIPCQSQGSARLSATSSTNRRRSQRAKCGNASSTLYDSGNERA